MDADDACALVSAMHIDLIRLDPDRATLDRLGGQLSRHGDCSAILHELLMSDQHCDLVIADNYHNILGRAPGTGEVATHKASIRAGRLSTTGLRLRIIEPIARDESRPFASRLALIYAVALGREVSVADANSWQRGLQTTSPSAILRQIWSSSESLAYRLAELYHQHLWRGPDQAATATWTRALVEEGDEPVRAGLVSSLEYLLLARKRATLRLPPHDPRPAAIG